MASISKIKFNDNIDLRKKIDDLNELIDQVTLAKWAIACAIHVTNQVDTTLLDDSNISNGIRINKQWQNNLVSASEIRQAGFKVHESAKNCVNEINKTALRAIGQAVAVGHMWQHAMVASDYAIKTIGLLYNNNSDKITSERHWQLNTLKKLVESK